MRSKCSRQKAFTQWTSTSIKYQILLIVSDFILISARKSLMRKQIFFFFLISVIDEKTNEALNIIRTKGLMFNQPYQFLFKRKGIINCISDSRARGESSYPSRGFTTPGKWSPKANLLIL